MSGPGGIGLEYGGGAGTQGPQGDSAYAVAVANGFVGTEVQWLASLIGATGATGATGQQGVQGPQGIQGEQGSSIIISDPGKTIDDTASQVTALSGAAYTIPANTLQVGDLIEVNYDFSCVNTTGGNITLGVCTVWDGANLVKLTTLNIATSVVCAVFGRMFIRVTAIGASGSVTCYHTLGVSGNFVSSTAQSHEATGTLAIDTTQDITLDLQVQKSSANSALDVVSRIATATLMRV